jgi:hypothetical protein
MPYADPEQRREFFKQRYAQVSGWIRAYKVEHGCADCGYREHHAALEFDHIEGRVLGTVSSLAGSSFARVLKEIARCEVVCRNCHGIRTHERAKDSPKYGRPKKTSS